MNATVMMSCRIAELETEVCELKAMNKRLRTASDRMKAEMEPLLKLNEEMRVALLQSTTSYTPIDAPTEFTETPGTYVPIAIVTEHEMNQKLEERKTSDPKPKDEEQKEDTCTKD